MLWGPSALGPPCPETCPGGGPMGRTPPGQELRAAHGGWGQTLHTSGVSSGRRKIQVEEEMFISPPQEPRFHGTQRGGASPSQGPAARRGEPGAPRPDAGCCPDITRPSPDGQGWRRQGMARSRRVSLPRRRRRDAALGAVPCRERRVPG